MFGQRRGRLLEAAPTLQQGAGIRLERVRVLEIVAQVLPLRPLDGSHRPHPDLFEVRHRGARPPGVEGTLSRTGTLVPRLSGLARRSARSESSPGTEPVLFKFELLRLPLVSVVDKEGSHEGGAGDVEVVGHVVGILDRHELVVLVRLADGLPGLGVPPEKVV